MDATVPADPALPRPDLDDLFAAEDSPMLGGLLLRTLAAGALVALVAWLLRRRRA